MRRLNAELRGSGFPVFRDRLQSIAVDCSRLLPTRWLLRFAAFLALTASSVYASPVLVSRDASGTPGTAASGAGIFGSAVPSPVTDAGVVYFLSSAPLSPLSDANQVVDVYCWEGTQTEPWSIGGSGGLAAVNGNCRGIRVGAGGTYAIELRPANEFTGIVHPFLWNISAKQLVDSGIPDTVSLDTADISADGRYIICSTSADELDVSPANGLTDVFRFDRQLGEMTQVSLTKDGDSPDAVSSMPSISSAGDRVVFLSQVADLTAVDSNGNNQAYAWNGNSSAAPLRLLSRRLDLAPTSLSSDVTLSANGSFAAFVSEDPGLVSGDEIGTVDVFRIDLDGDDVVRVSVGSDGQGANGACSSPALSANGRFVAFCSLATNLASAETHGVAQVYCRDMVEQRTLLISSAGDGEGADTACFAPAISPSGRYMTFASAASNLTDETTHDVMQVYLVDLGADFDNRSPVAWSRRISAQTGAAETVQVGGEDPDGDVLSFVITSLPAGCSVYDGTDTVQASLIQTGQLPFTLTDAAGMITVIPATGFAGVVGFSYLATDGVNQSEAAVVEIAFGGYDSGIAVSVTTPVIGSSPTSDAAPDGTPGRIGISDSGQRIAFASTAENLTGGTGSDSVRNVIVWDESLTVHPVASTADPAAGESTLRDSDDCALSSDGRFAVFRSLRQLVPEDTNVYADIYLRDLETKETTLVSWSSDGTPADGNCRSPDLSAFGDYVVFSSTAENLAVQETGGIEQVFLWEKETGQISLVSLEGAGEAAVSPCFNPRISADGTTIVFESTAALTQTVADGVQAVFVYRRPSGTIVRLDATVDGNMLSGDSMSPAVSQGGRYIAFASDADNLTEVVTQGYRGIYLYDAVTGSIDCISRTTSGVHADRHCFNPAISGDGRFVYFRSLAGNFVQGTTGNVMNGYLVDRSKLLEESGRIRLVSHAVDTDTESNGNSWGGALSQTGRYVAFASDATDLVGHNANSYRDIYRCDFGEPLNGGPTVSDYDVDVVQDEATTVVLQASDAEGDDLVFRLTTAPAHGSLTAFDASVSPEHGLPTVLYTPDEGYAGDDEFTFTVADGAVTVSCCVTLRISAPDQPPQLHLTDSRLLIPSGDESLTIPYSLFVVSDPDDPDELDDFIVEILAVPVMGEIQDASGASVTVNDILTSSDFPLVYKADDSVVSGGESIVFRVSIGDWVSESVLLDIAVGVVMQEFVLNAGWNLISFQMLPLDTDPEIMLSSLIGVEVTGPIWAWNPESRTYYEPDALNPGTAHWFFAESASDTPSSVPGYPVTDPGVLLLPGWNAVGPIGPAPTGSLPDLEGTGVSIIWEWRSETQTYGTADMLRAGHGYWLKTSREETIDLWLQE